MPIQLNARALADFDRPLDVLEDCHRRVERFLRMLQAVALAATNDGRLTEDAAGALDVALHYFHTAAPKHTADEEESLFPRLRASDDPRARRVLRDIERLERDHDRADALHDVVYELGMRWLERGALDRGELQRFARAVRQLRRIYESHITIEDAVVFPVAREVLDADVQLALGHEMRARRTRTGTAPPKPHPE